MIEKIIGLEKIVRNMRAEGKKRNDALSRGLLKAGLFLKRKSQEVVPVFTGNLKDSADVKKTGRGARMAVIVYYTASYAIYVHENLQARHKPGKIAKFLERPFRENLRTLRQIIRDEVSK